jgi:putative ABC transport system ATP-binding protein
MIEVENLTKTFAKGTVITEVLKGISFRVQKGEFIAVMGASGTGKTTLMNILGGLDKPTGGTYRLDGIDMARAGDDELSRIRNHKIGFVFQQFHLLDRVDAMKNVLLPLIYTDDDTNGNARAEKALEAVGLAHRKHYHPGELSGGEQQRVAIARALITDPAILLADEPTGNLDSKSGLEILAIFQQLHREGRTIVMISHDRTIAEHAHRLIVLKDGRIAADESLPQPRDAASELRQSAETDRVPKHT